MALLNYLYLNAVEFNIELSALNCDHGMRGENSARDSAFVKEWCKQRKIPLLTFVWKDFDCEEKTGLKSENEARDWRRKCYCKAMSPQKLADGTLWRGVDAVATAHHKNDNAESVLFNLARGSGLAGLKGITDSQLNGLDSGVNLKLIRPLICCSRAEIDEYVRVNGVEYVEDESNFTENYTRNKIRMRVLPELEKTVGGAVENIYRFSRLAAEDEEYFDKLIADKGLIKLTDFGAEIYFCEEKAVFKRAALKAVYLLKQNVRDYTSEHLQRLFGLQFAENGKKFEFLNITAYKEDGKLVLCSKNILDEAFKIQPFCGYKDEEQFFCGELCEIFSAERLEKEFETLSRCFSYKLKILKFDYDRIPESAVIRFVKPGDKFRKFGGGTKNLGDFFTDKKIPVRIRNKIPLIADGQNVLAVCGVEISEIIKVTKDTVNVYCVICADYRDLNEKE